MNQSNFPKCPSCNAHTVPGARWCPICRSNIFAPSVGTLASRGRRFGAFILEHFAPFFVTSALSALTAFAAITETSVASVFGAVLGFLFALGYFGIIVALFARGTSPGKYLLGMYVVKEDGQRADFLTMVIRELVGKPISGLVFCLGFLWILFDKDHQGWHDKLLGTYVVSVPRARNQAWPHVNTPGTNTPPTPQNDHASI